MQFWEEENLSDIQENVILSVRQGINLYYGQLKVQISSVQENLKIYSPIKSWQVQFKKEIWKWHSRGM